MVNDALMHQPETRHDASDHPTDPEHLESRTPSRLADHGHPSGQPQCHELSADQHHQSGRHPVQYVLIEAIASLIAVLLLMGTLAIALWRT